MLSREVFEITSVIPPLVQFMLHYRQTRPNDCI
jgi:hypothetical protein